MDQRNPTKEDLVEFYLPLKVRGNHSQVNAIAEIDNINKYEPWDLPGLVAIPSSKRKWHFFSPRNSERTKRLTKAGFWKVTGRRLEIKNTANQVIIKRYLVFYTGRSSNQEWTNWAMHEYYLKPSDSNGRGYVVYRLRQKSTKIKKMVNSAVDEGELSRDSASVVENRVTDTSLPEIDQCIDEILNSDEQDFTSPTEHQQMMHINQDPSFLNLEGTNGTINDYNEPFPLFGISDQHTALDGSSSSGSLGIPYIGYISCIEAVNPTVDHCLPETHMVQGLSCENFQPVTHISQYPSFVNLQGTNGTFNYHTEAFSQFGIGDQHSVLDGSCASGSLDSPYIGYISCTEAVNATVDHCLSEMHMLPGLSYGNFQQTNGNIDDNNFMLSQSGASYQLENISELEKSFSAIPDVHSYRGSIQTAPSDLNWSFEPASAYSSYT